MSDLLVDDAPVRSWRSRAELVEQVKEALQGVLAPVRLEPTKHENVFHAILDSEPPRRVPAVFFHLPRFRELLQKKPSSLEAALEGALFEAAESVSSKALFLFGLTPESKALTYNERCRQALIGSAPFGYALIAKREILQDMAEYMCKWAPDEGPVNPPSLGHIKEALDKILKKGLPLSPSGGAEEALFSLLPDAQDAYLAGHSLTPIARLQELISQHLVQFEIDELREAAKILFAYTPGTKGTNLNRRQELAANELGISPEHLRKQIRPKIIDTFAWQLYRSKYGTNY